MQTERSGPPRLHVQCMVRYYTCKEVCGFGWLGAQECVDMCAERVLGCARMCGHVSRKGAWVRMYVESPLRKGVQQQGVQFRRGAYSIPQPPMALLIRRPGRPEAGRRAAHNGVRLTRMTLLVHNRPGESRFTLFECFAPLHNSRFTTLLSFIPASFSSSSFFASAELKQYSQQRQCWRVTTT